MYMASWKVAPALAAGQHRDPQAGLVLPDDGDPDGRAGARGGHPARRPERRDRARAARPAPRSPRIPGIGKVAFTGETTTGQEIMRLASNNVKKISLELGGKSANVVYADADIERFAAESPYSVFDNCGQDCCARSRILVERSVARAGRRAVRRGDAEGRRRRPVGRQDRGRDARQLQAARPGQGLHRDRARGGREARRRRRRRRMIRRWPRVRISCRRSSMASRTTCGSRRRRSSARWSRSSRSTPRPRRSSSRTRRRTACPARSGAATSARRCGPRRASRRATCR